MSDNGHTEFVPSEANSRVVSSFIDYLKVEKGLGALTVSAYTRDIGQFAAFLDNTKRTLMNARRDDVRGFLQELFSNSVDGRSVARKLSALRHLYR
jgi:integrase/recombinase XerD